MYVCVAVHCNVVCVTYDSMFHAMGGCGTVHWFGVLKVNVLAADSWQTTGAVVSLKRDPLWDAV